MVIRETVEVVELPLTDLSSNETQTRERLRETAVEDYSNKLKDGEEIDAAVVYYDGNKTWLAAGFHRREAHRRLNRTTMPCEKRHGSKWDAIQFGINDNLKHRGERLSMADKRHNIRLVLSEHPEWSNARLAEMCGVSDKTVSKVRQQCESTSEIPRLTERTGQDGRTRLVVPNQRAAQHLDIEHCNCGGQWVSDGQGERFCEECQSDHPDNPTSPQVAAKGQHQQEYRLRKLFKEIWKRHGRLHHSIHSLRNEVGKSREFGEVDQSVERLHNSIERWSDSLLRSVANNHKPF